VERGGRANHKVRHGGKTPNEKRGRVPAQGKKDTSGKVRGTLRKKDETESVGGEDLETQTRYQLGGRPEQEQTWRKRD